MSDESDDDRMRALFPVAETVVRLLLDQRRRGHVHGSDVSIALDAYEHAEGLWLATRSKPSGKRPSARRPQSPQEAPATSLLSPLPAPAKADVDEPAAAAEVLPKKKRPSARRFAGGHPWDARMYPKK